MVESLIAYLLLHAPWLLKIIMVMGTARLVIKPIMVALRSIVDSTPTPKDNSLLDRAEQSKIYLGVCFVLDYVASIKLPK